MFINSYYLFFFDVDFAHDNILDHGRELDEVFAKVSGQSCDEDTHENNEEEEVEDWMLCRLKQYYEESGNAMFENTTDWFETSKSVPVEVLRDCPEWIYKTKEMEEGQQLVMQPEVVVIDPASLNEKQTLAFNIVKSHAERLRTSASL